MSCIPLAAYSSMCQCFALTCLFIGCIGIKTPVCVCEVRTGMRLTVYGIEDVMEWEGWNGLSKRWAGVSAACTVRLREGFHWTSGTVRAEFWTWRGARAKSHRLCTCKNPFNGRHPRRHDLRKVCIRIPPFAGSDHRPLSKPCFIGCGELLEKAGKEWVGGKSAIPMDTMIV